MAVIGSFHMRSCSSLVLLLGLLCGAAVASPAGHAEACIDFASAAEDGEADATEVTLLQSKMQVGTAHLATAGAAAGKHEKSHEEQVPVQAVQSVPIAASAQSVPVAVAAQSVPIAVAAQSVPFAVAAQVPVVDCTALGGYHVPATCAGSWRYGDVGYQGCAIVGVDVGYAWCSLDNVYVGNWIACQCVSAPVQAPMVMVVPGQTVPPAPTPIMQAATIQGYSDCNGRGGYQVPASCASTWLYGDVSYQGCVTVGVDVRYSWCSIDSVYVGNFLPCSCSVALPAQVPVVQTVPVGHVVSPSPTYVAAPVVSVQAQVGCSPTWFYGDVEHVGCAIVGVGVTYSWCSLDRVYSGNWIECPVAVATPAQVPAVSGQVVSAAPAHVATVPFTQGHSDCTNRGGYQVPASCAATWVYAHSSYVGCAPAGVDMMYSWCSLDHAYAGNWIACPCAQVAPAPTPAPPSQHIEVSVGGDVNLNTNIEHSNVTVG